MAIEAYQIRNSGQVAALNKEEKVKQRFHENLKAVTECLNYEELVPLLCQGSDDTVLLSSKDGHSLLDSSLSRSSKVDLLTQKLESKSYSKLLECLKREPDHLGHDYICDLLEGTEHASEKETAYSKAVRNAVQMRLPDFTKGINIQELAPHMVQQRLLTTSEVKQLCDSTQSRTKKMFLLLDIINTKGPLGYLLFAKSLKSENSHVTHGQLYDMIHEVVKEPIPETSTASKKRVYEDCSTEIVTTLNKRTCCRLTLHGVLTGKKYDK